MCINKQSLRCCLGISISNGSPRNDKNYLTELSRSIDYNYHYLFRLKYTISFPLHYNLRGAYEHIPTQLLYCCDKYAQDRIRFFDELQIPDYQKSLSQEKLYLRYHRRQNSPAKIYYMFQALPIPPKSCFVVSNSVKNQSNRMKISRWQLELRIIN